MGVHDVPEAHGCRTCTCVLPDGYEPGSFVVDAKNQVWYKSLDDTKQFPWQQVYGAIRDHGGYSISSINMPCRRLIFAPDGAE